MHGITYIHSVLLLKPFYIFDLNLFLHLFRHVLLIIHLFYYTPYSFSISFLQVCVCFYSMDFGLNFLKKYEEKIISEGKIFHLEPGFLQAIC